jgi:hypothetical protein
MGGASDPTGWDHLNLLKETTWQTMMERPAAVAIF